MVYKPLQISSLRILQSGQVCERGLLVETPRLAGGVRLEEGVSPFEVHCTAESAESHIWTRVPVPVPDGTEQAGQAGTAHNCNKQLARLSTKRSSQNGSDQADRRRRRRT